MRYEPFGRNLERELPTWVEEGLVSAEQASAIRDRYAESARESRRGAIVQALALVGAVAAGLGVILFFAANWDAIPRPARVALLVGALLGAYGGGYVLRFARRTRPAVGTALLFLGGILFGATIFLVGQMYHVQAHDPLAFLLWTAGVAPTAVALQSRALTTLSLLTFGGWLVYELADRAGATEGYVVVALALYGVALYASGTGALGPLGTFAAAPMRQLGYVACCAGVFVFTFRDFLAELAVREPLDATLEVGLVAGTAAAAAAIAFLAARRPRRTALFEAAALAAVPLLVGLAILVPESTGGGLGESRAVLYPVLFNLLLIVLALGAVVVGYVNDEVLLVNAGVVVVAVEIFARYVDFFWGLLPRSLVFIGGGLLLLLLAFGLERQRSRLVGRMAAT
jgi:uncharacterized membrane protein